jgi:hypothetical protein
MAANGGGRRVRPELVVAVITLVLAALGLVPRWVPFLEAEGWDAGWLRGLLGWLHQWWKVLFGLALASLVAYLLWMFRRGLRSGIGATHRRVLWRLVVKPARDRFGVEAVEEPRRLDPRFADVLRERLRGLDADSLWVLEGALARRERGSDEAVLEYPDGMRLYPRESGAAQAKPRFEEALDRLKGTGVIVSWEQAGKETPRDFSIRVMFPTADSRALERLRVVAEVERARKSLQDDIDRATEWVQRAVREGRSASGQVDLLSLAAVRVLHYILQQHDPQRRSGLVIMNPGEVRKFLERLGVGLTYARNAFGELEAAGFVDSVEWPGDEENDPLIAHVGTRLRDSLIVEELRAAVRTRLEREGLWARG